jgi:predicted nicotinamide N-methyase
MQTGSARLRIVDVTEEVEVDGRLLAITHPHDATELIDEEAFGCDEFLPYWAELWPSSVVLAGVVAALRTDGLAVVELGCGLALPSIVAALGGARVLATDWSPEALAYVERNARANGAKLETAHVAWADADALVDAGPFDLVLAADVLYEPRNSAQLLELLPRLGGEVLLADPGRPALDRFVGAAAERWRVEVTPADGLPRGAVYRLVRRVT